jgi:aerobic carbon-monoxide dehydrogenase medium subunit
VKPPPFEYHRPESLQDVVSLLAELGPDAKLLAGGQSLVPLLNFRVARPSALIDLNRVDELRGVRGEDGRLVVGAMTRQYDLEVSGEMRAACPMLGEALHHVGHLAIRTRGTVGGSIAHAEPTAELGVAAVAVGADIVTAAGRTIRAEDFYESVFMTALEPTDVLTEVRFPSLDGRGWAFEEFALRAGDFAVVDVAAVVEGGGAARVAIGGVGAVPQLVSGESRGEVAERVEAEVQPFGDPHIPAGYRRDLVRELVGRALERAAERASA